MFNVKLSSVKHWFSPIFFMSGFSSDTNDSQGNRGRKEIIFCSTLPLSQTLRHLFATLHVSWLSPIFNRNTCDSVTRWDLPPYRFVIWVIDWWCNVCLLTWLINTRFLLQRLDIGKRWIWARIKYTLELQANRLTRCANHLWKTFI